ncbi:MAG TPA: hypothetical protein VNO14_12225, partial [Blastocatellia bacterium]|nr:hypothetical protein [Blastocatellia bacterium]
LTEALGGTLYGMKTAFGCTLAGIFTAVITSYLNHHVRRTQSRVAAGLEDFVIFDLLPALEAFDPNADNTAKAFANAMSSSAKKLNQVQKTISEAAGKYEEGSQELHRAVEALGSVVQSFSNSISVVASNQQAFTQTMSDTRNALNSMASMLTKQFEDLRAHTALSNKVLEERLNIMEQASKTNTSLQESLHTLAQSFQPAILEYHKQFREFLGASQEEFRNSLKGLLTEINQHYRDGVSAHVSNSQKAFDDALKAHAEEMKQLIEKQGAALSAFCDMVLDANIRMGTLYNRITGDDNHREKIATQGGLQ